MIKRNSIFFLVLIIILTFCFVFLNSDKKKINENENYLLGISDTLKSIKIDFNNFKNEILLDIAIKLNEDLCCKKVNFNLEIDDSKLVNVTTSKKCSFCSMHYRTAFYSDNIFINRNNLIFYNAKLIKIDSIKHKVSKTLKKRTPLDKEFFSVEWDKTAKESTIKNVLLEIQKGHLIYYENESEKIFKKPIKDLNKFELDSINENKFLLFLNLSPITLPELPPLKPN